MEQHVIRNLFAILLLVAATVAIHGGGTLIMLRIMAERRLTFEKHFGYVRSTLVLAFTVIALLLLHLAEVFVWAAYFVAKGCLPDLMTSIYFSLVTYSTVGYGDVVLHSEWRLLAGVEALTGVLMISWSTALLLGVVGWVNTRMLNRWGLKISDR